MLTRFRTANARATRWLHDHVVAWWLLLALVPGGVYACLELLVTDASLSHAAILGGTFGIVFATVSVLVRRFRGG